MRILGSAASGIRAQQVAMDTLGNNIANVNTPGYKAEQVDFAQTLTAEIRTINESGQITNAGIGSGVIFNGIKPNFNQGNFITSDNPLDLGIDGQGFFQVSLPNGTIAYTRAGAFKVDGEGYISDAQGNLLLGSEIVNNQPQLKPIKLPIGTKDIAVDATGKIYGKVDEKEQLLGQILISSFQNPQGLLKVGDSIYQESQNSGTAIVGLPGAKDDNVVLGTIRPRSLEQSNVDLGQAMTDLIQVQRAYQMNSRMIQNGDQMWGIANSLRR